MKSNKVTTSDDESVEMFWKELIDTWDGLPPELVRFTLCLKCHLDVEECSCEE